MTTHQVAVLAYTILGWVLGGVMLVMLVVGIAERRARIRRGQNPPPLRLREAVIFVIVFAAAWGALRLLHTLLPWPTGWRGAVADLAVLVAASLVAWQVGRLARAP
jgi:hypothetical protein